VKTRRSVRNQNILFKALFAPKNEPVNPVEIKCCFKCISYPKQGRGRGECTLGGMIVLGKTMDRECF
jgi:hypothetical protein